MSPVTSAEGNNFTAAEAFAESARTAAVGAFTLELALNADSREIARELGVGSEGLLEQDEWPLVHTHLAQLVVAETVTTTLRQLEEEANFRNPQKRLESDPRKPLWDGKIYNETLVETYNLGQRKSKARFVADLVTWANQMTARDWPLLLAVSLDESRRTEVRVYQDTEAARQHYAADLAASEGKSNPKIFQIDRVVVRYGTPAFKQRVQDQLATQQA